MYFKESIGKVFGGNKSISRQLTLFSICGILGLAEIYVMLSGFDNLALWAQICYIALWLLFILFFTGYEVIFLNERELPEIDMRSYKIVFSKVLLAVVAFQLAIFALKLTTINAWFMLFCDILIAIPLVAIQAGYSYNFSEEEAFSLLKRTTLKDFIFLFFKRAFIIFMSYFLVFITVIIALVGLAIGILIASKGSSEAILYVFTSQQVILAKLVMYVAGVLLCYTLTNGALMWDYELIKTYENKQVEKAE